MNDQSTIIYYSSNREKESFEKNICDILIENSGGLPIISVTQKPMDLGTNICIGEVGFNNDNLYRQILIGCEAATTKFVISAESDFVYPPEYFSFIPPTDDIYRYDNIYLLMHNQDGYFKKYWSEGAQIVNREHYISMIRKALEGLPMWNNTIQNNRKRLDPSKMKRVFPKNREGIKFFTGRPAISVKSGYGLRRTAGTQGNHEGIADMSFWGTSMELRTRLGL